MTMYVLVSPRVEHMNQNMPIFQIYELFCKVYGYSKYVTLILFHLCKYIFKQVYFSEILTQNIPP